MATAKVISSSGYNMMNTDIGDVLEGDDYTLTPTEMKIAYFTGGGLNEYDQFTGSGFTYNANGEPLSGTVTGYVYYYLGKVLEVTGLNALATKVLGYAEHDDTDGFLNYVLRNNDKLVGNSGPDKFGAYDGIDNLQGKGGNDLLDGGNDNDKLFGGNGKDRLFGRRGKDLLIGGGGIDTLVGGLGADRFKYIRAKQGGDLIKDFKRAQNDKIAFAKGNFRGNNKGNLFRKHFRANLNGNAKDSNDFFLFSTKSQTLFYDSDGNGAKAKVKIARFANLGSALKNTDILMV